MFAYLVAIALTLMAWFIHSHDPGNNQLVISQQRIDTLAKSYFVYQDVVSQYVSMNPNVTGTIVDSTLSLPLGFINPGIQNKVLTDGTVQIWLPVDNVPLPEQKKILGRLNEVMYGYENLGRVETQGFYHPIRGSIVNPTLVQGVPIGAIAIFIKSRP